MSSLKIAAVALACAIGSLGGSIAHAIELKPFANARDGSHDFDFNIGHWQTHIVRRLHPLSDSTETIELNGTVDNRPLFGGRCELEEIETDGPQGHWEGMSVFLYDPAGHQWSQTFINSAHGAFSNGLIGNFENGVGRLYQSDTIDGRQILVRGEWSKITPNTHQYEESYSDDGGKTWAKAFTASLTRRTP